eukprot:1259-Heterococcus_DN1.PRE.4
MRLKNWLAHHDRYFCSIYYQTIIRRRATAGRQTKSAQSLYLEYTHHPAVWFDRNGILSLRIVVLTLKRKQQKQ